MIGELLSNDLREVGGKSLDSAARDRFFSCPKQTLLNGLKIGN
jgi:hypothetical protein